MKTKTSRTEIQLARVFNTIADGKWHTLRGVAKRTADPVQSVSARIRDFRKPRFGRFTVEREQRGTVFAYRLSI